MSITLLGVKFFSIYNFMETFIKFILNLLKFNNPMKGKSSFVIIMTFLRMHF